MLAPCGLESGPALEPCCALLLRMRGGPAAGPEDVGVALAAGAVALVAGAAAPTDPDVSGAPGVLAGLLLLEGTGAPGLDEPLDASLEDPPCELDPPGELAPLPGGSFDDPPEDGWRSLPWRSLRLRLPAWLEP